MEFTVDTESRLDAFIATKASFSRSRVRKAIDLELVTINGVTELKPARKVRTGDTVEIDVDALPVEGAPIVPTDLKLQVLYEDDACMVIVKPSGISVHPGAGMPPDEATILHGIAYLMGERGLPFSTETSLVHRLDKDTTGCLLVAKTAAAHTALQEQFADRTVKKSYLAIVAGVPAPATAMIDAPIGRNLTDRTKMSILRTSVSREARTTYNTLVANSEVALLKLDLHTGRTHQIRVHLASVGHPLLGDPAYGTSASDALSRGYGASAVCLHAWEIMFTSPADSTVHTVTAPLTPYLQGVLTHASLALPSA